MDKTMVLAGPRQVAYGRFASLKGALNLESKGLYTRGGALRPRLAKEFGLKPRAPYEDYINYCIAKMNELLKEEQESPIVPDTTSNAN